MTRHGSARCEANCGSSQTGPKVGSVSSGYGRSTWTKLTTVPVLQLR